MVHAVLAVLLVVFATFDAFAQPLPRKGGQSEEIVEGVDIRYGEARSDKGYRIRTYTSRPKAATGRLPVAIFIPWLSCNAVENPKNLKDGWSFALRVVMREAGMQVVRIEKPGVGDSEGPACGDADLEDDMAAFRAGIRAALADPGADPTRVYLIGGSVGGALAPLLAAEVKPRGIVVSGGFTLTWYEHMLDIERRYRTLSGGTPSEVNAAMRALSGFYDATLNRSLTPEQAIAAHPAWKAFWKDEPTRMYGRPMRYYQQLQALDVERAWAEVTAPTLIVWGENDWIMGREEAERAAAILRARDASLVTLAIRPEMDHQLFKYKDAKASMAARGGVFDDGMAKLVVEWLRSH
jgi:pimeloyl-ACP methyl ester carboxylesterase